MEDFKWISGENVVVSQWPRFKCMYGCPTSGKKGSCPEALGVDVFATVRKLGYPIEVLTDYNQEMNRYSFLMVE